MRRFTIALLLLLVFSLACRALLPGPDGRLLPTTTALPSPPLIPTSTPRATAPVLPSLTPAQKPAPASTAAPEPATGEQGLFVVRAHPDGGLYAGDLVSFEVIAPADVAMDGQQVQIDLPGQNDPEPVDFRPYGIGGRIQATFTWVWDTAGLDPGTYGVTFSVTPSGPTWEETYSLLPAASLPPPEPGAAWASAESDCCLVYYITGTAAERDLAPLLEMLDQNAASAGARWGLTFDEPLTITFLPRVLGHGGFTSSEIAVSYLDRNYAANDSGMVIHHEMVHLLDGRMGGDLRPTILVEGLAVYLSGGHFKPEPLLPRAAALLPPDGDCTPVDDIGVSTAGTPVGETCGIDRYLPLVELADHFYTSQHEIGYLQAAAFIEYLVETWGWDAFEAFYRDIHPAEDGKQSTALSAALQAHFGLDLEALEARFLERLNQEQVTPALAEDVRLSVAFFDTVRRYQQALDPSAYFLTAWLPDLAAMRERGIVADLLRHPDEPENRALEDLLVAAGAALRAGDYPRTGRLLAAVNASLDVFQAH